MANQEDIALMGHLCAAPVLGRAGRRLKQSAQGYNAVVEELLSPDSQSPIDEDIKVRYHPAYNHSAAIETNVQQWLYHDQFARQLQEHTASSGT
jgi:hypothetical protein